MNSNQRTDGYGGSIGDRARFLLEVADATIKAIGKDKSGICLCLLAYSTICRYTMRWKTITRNLAQLLKASRLVYIHLVDHSSMDAPIVPALMKATFRRVFKGKLILSGGYDAARAESDLAAGKCNLIAVGRPFLAIPDLIPRWKAGATLNEIDFNTCYMLGAKGYTNYPVLS